MKLETIRRAPARHRYQETRDTSAEINMVNSERPKRKRVAAVLCHGVAALMHAQLSDSSYLIAGKTMTGFANVGGAFFVGSLDDGTIYRTWLR
jgi:putative intracellular protease/amidase